ncbi:hypothetical protein [Curtobacterium sp. 24E2]|nr:hypothetical protein JN350_08410 [Curtobacterium sp. 24E2]
MAYTRLASAAESAVPLAEQPVTTSASVAAVARAAMVLRRMGVSSGRR